VRERPGGSTRHPRIQRATRVDTIRWVAPAAFLVLLYVLGAQPGHADPGIPGTFRVRTYIGNGLPNPVAPLDANIWPYGMYVTADGTIYFSSHSVVRRLRPGGLVETIAGTYPHNWQPGEGGPALQADFSGASDMVLDLDGSLIVADIYWSVVRRIAPDGTVRTVAGRWGVWGFGGDGGPATEAKLGNPVCLAFGPDRSLYVSDYLRVRRISPDGIISTFAGNGTDVSGADGEGGPATDASVSGSRGMAVDVAGSVFLAVSGQSRVRRVGTDGILTTIAGMTYGWSVSGDGGPAIAAEIGKPSDVAFDASGNLLIADSYNGVIRVIDQNGIINTLAGTGEKGYSGDEGPARQAMLGSIIDMEFDAAGNLYLLDDSEFRIRKIDTDGIITTVAGNGTKLFGGDGGPAQEATFWSPHDPTIAPDGSIFIADIGNRRIRRIGPNGIVTTYAGNGTLGSMGDGGPAIDATLATEDLALAPDGTLYFLDGSGGGARIRRIDPSGVVHHVAGRDGEGYAGDGGPAATALFKRPTDIWYSVAHQRLFIADTENNRVRYIDSTGYIWTLIGNGSATSTGDGGPASLATVFRPGCVYATDDGKVYVSEASGNRVRMIDTSGIVTTVAGGAERGFGGDGGPAVLAKLSVPVGLFRDRWGYLYIADAANNRIRRVSPNGMITTVAGTGMEFYDGEDVPALSANLWKPVDVAGGPGDVLYVASQWSGRISMLVPALRVPVGFGNLRAEASSGGVTLSWVAWSDERVEYVVEQGDGSTPTTFRTIALRAGLGAEQVEHYVPWSSTDRPGARVAYRVRVRDLEGLELTMLGPVQVSVGGPLLPQRASLSAHPNPFNPRVIVTLALPEAGDIELAAFDAAGRKVAILATGRLGAGRRDVVWEGKDSRGAELASGVYHLELSAAGATLARLAVTLVR
jgi:hypothetical protein